MNDIKRGKERAVTESCREKLDKRQSELIRYDTKQRELPAHTFNTREKVSGVTRREKLEAHSEEATI